MPSIVIRIATRQDAELIASLSRRTFQESFAKFNTKRNMDKFMEVQFTEEVLMAEVEDPVNIFLLASIDNKPVGYVKLCESPKPPELDNIDVIEIARIYSEQKTIGKGVGKALMLQCIAIAKEKKKKAIWLGVWEHNEHAISFYKKFGFEQFSSHVFMLGDDAQTDLLLKKIFE
ncbi:MAG TPA: GNAT family N-acetyltransferase [Puia sp.]|nr:GNAT family N-acetyltransferase [Puia sp.]